MKLEKIWLLIVLVLMASTGFTHGGNKSVPVTDPYQAPAPPEAVVSEPRYDFKTVIAGKIVDHEFSITNKGRSSLIIENVRTTCGCTTARYDKEIMPGKKGKVHVRANTAGYEGHRFEKTIRVQTNDPKNREILLHIVGQPEPFALISPRQVMLRGTPGSVLKAVVSITPVAKYPFTITDTVMINLENKSSRDLRRSEKEYLLMVTNIQKTPGTYFGRIILKTDNAVQPEIVIPVRGLIQKEKTGEQ